MSFVFRRPWTDWRRYARSLPFLLPPPDPPQPEPPAPSKIRDRRGILTSLVDRSQLSDPAVGLAFKTAVRCATSLPIVLNGLQTIDTIAAAAGDRVLVKDQLDAKDNGIYVASTGNWRRAADAAANIALAGGTQIFVRAGRRNVDKVFVLETEDQLVLGDSELIFSERFFPRSALEFTLDGGGMPLAVGRSYALEVPYDCAIRRSVVLADAAGSIELDVYRNAYATWPAVASICGNARPKLTTSRKSQDSVLKGWDVLLNQGDLLTAQILSVTGLRLATLSLPISRNR